MMRFYSERLHELGPEMPQYVPQKLPTRLCRRITLQAKKYLGNISFYLVQLIFATEPTEKST